MSMINYRLTDLAV